jgi:hypothetical protein
MFVPSRQGSRHAELPVMPVIPYGYLTSTLRRLACLSLGNIISKTPFLKLAEALLMALHM